MMKRKLLNSFKRQMEMEMRACLCVCVRACVCACVYHIMTVPTTCSRYSAAIPECQTAGMLM